MTQHTPDTWSYGEDNDSWYVSVGDTQIAYGLSEENACHIVACVDACAGIVNPDIKIPKLQEALIEAVEQLQKAEQQSAELMVEVSEFRAIRDRLAAQDKAGTLPDDYSIYIGMLENRLSEQRGLNSVMEQQRDELQKRCDNQHDAIYEIIDAAGELVSIVKIHSQATNNNFAWAELQNLEEAIAKAGDKL